MTTYTLNIGLIPSKHSSRKENITRAEVLAAVRGAGFKVNYYRVAQSATEPTAILVVEARHPFISTACYNISLALVQDCIAVRNDSNGFGYLAGPNADEWGEFNPEYFIEFRVTDDQGKALAA